jgi:hypothetical protein
MLSAGWLNHVLQDNAIRRGKNRGLEREPMLKNLQRYEVLADMDDE